MKPLFWFKALKGVLCASVITSVLLCLFAFIGLRSEDPSQHLALYANAALLFGVAVGGGVAARNVDAPFISSLLCGVLSAVLLLLPSIVLSKWGAQSLLRIALTVAASLLGGLVLRGREGNAVRKQSAKKRKAIAKKYGSA